MSGPATGRLRAAFSLAVIALSVAGLGASAGWPARGAANPGPTTSARGGSGYEAFNLRGMYPGEVQTLFFQLPDRIRYKPLDGNCDGRHVTGVIAKQHPKPGRPLKGPGLVTTAYVRCPDATLPRCNPHALKLDLDADQPDFTGGSELAVVYLRLHHAGPDCELKTPFKLTVLTGSGRIAPIPNNPIKLDVDRFVAGHKSMDMSWLWDSWCGRFAKNFQVRVQTLGKQSTARVPDTPQCARRTRGLHVFYGPDTTLGTGRIDPFGPSAASPVFGAPSVRYHYW